MRQVVLTQGTNTGSTNVWTPDRYIVPTNISAYLVVTSGAGSWSLESTVNDPQDPAFTAASATWLRFTGELSGVAANSAALITRCPLGMRLTMDSGTGTASLTLIQVGPGK